jgi:hypothetical protein
MHNLKELQMATNRKKIDKIITATGVLLTILLVVIGGLSWWAYSFINSNVQSELASQKIYFPSIGNPQLKNPLIGPYLTKYAGQELLTGPEAKAYADHYIAVHLSEIANGQTYAQVSSEAQNNPSNLKLKAEAQTLFQGETLRGLLLGDAYAFSTIASIAQIVAIVCFAGGAILVILVIMGLWHISTL